MKKIIIAGICIVVIACTIFFSLGINNPRYPNIKVTYYGKMIESTKCPIHWSTLFSHRMYDYVSRYELPETAGAFDVKANTHIKISFTRIPENIEISMWDGKSETQLPNDKLIEVPNKKGTYIYRVVGYWEQGEVAYLFKIRSK